MRDMREILELARDDAPPPRSTVDDLIAAGRRRRRRRVLVSRAAGVGAAASLALLIVTLVGGQTSGGFTTAPADKADKTATEPQITGRSKPFTFTFPGYTVGNYRVLAPDQVSPAYQIATIVRDTADAKVEFVGNLTVFQPGAFSTEKFQNGTRVTVRGREGFQARLEHKLLTEWRVDRYVTNSDPANDSADTVATDALAWQYAPGAWAVIDSEMFPSPDQRPFGAADQVTLAESFRVGPYEPVAAKVPFRPGYLPAGFELLSVDGQSMSAEGRGMVTFVYAKPDSSLDVVSGPRDFHNTSPVPAAVISVLWVDDPPPDAVARASRCNDGQHWCMRTLEGNELWVAISDPAKSLGDEELLRIVDGLSFATVKDPATWFSTS